MLLLSFPTGAWQIGQAKVVVRSGFKSWSSHLPPVILKQISYLPLPAPWCCRDLRSHRHNTTPSSRYAIGAPHRTVFANIVAGKALGPQLSIFIPKGEGHRFLHEDHVSSLQAADGKCRTTGISQSLQLSHLSVVSDCRFEDAGWGSILDPRHTRVKCPLREVSCNSPHRGSRREETGQNFTVSWESQSLSLSGWTLVRAQSAASPPPTPEDPHPWQACHSHSLPQGVPTFGSHLGVGIGLEFGSPQSLNRSSLGGIHISPFPYDGVIGCAEL